jgi:hypothetical protein
MRVGREEDDCIAQQGVLFIVGDPLGPAAPGVRRLGAAASPNPNPNGLAAARGRQHPVARVAPPQILMGCGPVVAVAQSLPIQYSNKLKQNSSS